MVTPKAQNTLVDYDGERFVITCHPWDHTARRAPEMQKDPYKSMYYLPPTEDNIHYINEKFNRKSFTGPAVARVIQSKAEEKKKEHFPKWYKFKNEPMEKQWVPLHLGWSINNLALFMEMGTGKTFVTINLAAARALNGDINALIVICPTSVKPVWEIELEKHCPIDYKCFILESGAAGKSGLIRFINDDTPGMKVLIAGIESLSQGQAYDLIDRFAAAHRCMVAVDESSRIKNPTTARTKKAILIGKEARYRLILTGTPITQGMEDLYPQYRFLDWKILGERSFYTYRYTYCIMGGFEGRKVIGYQNVEQLMEKIKPVTVQILKSEMMDLPPKIFEPKYIDPSPSQKKALKELGDPFEMRTVIDDKVLEVETVLERMTRYQQIVGGHFPFEEDGEAKTMRIPGKNPKMEELIQIVEALPRNEKVIIWARFIPEMDWIKEEMEQFGQVLLYRGDTTPEERKFALQEFQNPHSPYRFFVSSSSMGGIGITLTESNTTVYYSNTFSLEDRMQSEDRNHRKGQLRHVTYLDLIMNHNIDKSMVEALRRKKSILDYVREELEDKQ